MKAGTSLSWLAVAILLAASASCAGYSYSSTGRAWAVVAGEAIVSDHIRARRVVTFSATGHLEAGTVTVTLLRDGMASGAEVTIPTGEVELEVERPFEEGLWSYIARADASARGELYLAIGDR